MSTREAVQRADEELLASLGYKQEFRRAFTPIEVSISTVTQGGWSSKNYCLGIRHRVLYYRSPTVNIVSPVLRNTEWRRTCNDMGGTLCLLNFMGPN